MFPAVESHIFGAGEAAISIPLIDPNPVKAQIFPHLFQDVHNLGTLIHGIHPGVIVHQIILALTNLEQVSGAGRFLPLDTKGQPGSRQISAVVRFGPQLLEPCRRLLVGVEKLNGCMRSRSGMI